MSENPKEVHSRTMLLGLYTTVLVDALGMHAENIYRQQCGNSIAYGADAFEELHDKVVEGMRVYKEVIEGNLPDSLTPVEVEDAESGD